MKKKNLNARLSLQKKTITLLNENAAARAVGGGLNSINVCVLSKRNCEPSWDGACLSHLSGCNLCPTFGTCEM